MKLAEAAPEALLTEEEDLADTPGEGPLDDVTTADGPQLESDQAEADESESTTNEGDAQVGDTQEDTPAEIL